MSPRHCGVLVLGSLVAVTIGATPAAGQAVASFSVAYDHLDSKLERALAGTLEVDGESMTFRARNQQIRWTVRLEDIESINLEEVMSPVKMRIRTVVIESREGDTAIKRRIVPVDETLQFVSPVVVSGVMKERWKRFSEQRRAALARQR